MRVVFETNDDDKELNAELLDLVRRRSTTATVGDAVWTPERADAFIAALRPNGRRLLRAVAEGDGWVDGAKFRAEYGDSALRGPTTNLTNTIRRGIQEQWLPADAELPLTSTYDGRSSWTKTGGYRLPRHLAAIFRDAFARVYPARRGDPQQVLDHLTLLYEEMGQGSRARKFAEQFLIGHADDLAAWIEQHAVEGVDQ